MVGEVLICELVLRQVSVDGLRVYPDDSRILLLTKRICDPFYVAAVSS